MVFGMSAIVVDTLVPGNIFFLFFLHLASFLHPVSIFYIISNTKSLIPLLKTNPTIVECVVMTFSLLAVFVVHLICPNVLNVANGHFGIYWNSSIFHRKWRCTIFSALIFFSRTMVNANEIHNQYCQDLRDIWRGVSFYLWFVESWARPAVAYLTLSNVLIDRLRTIVIFTLEIE